MSSRQPIQRRQSQSKNKESQSEQWLQHKSFGSETVSSEPTNYETQERASIDAGLNTFRFADIDVIQPKSAVDEPRNERFNKFPSYSQEQNNFLLQPEQAAPLDMMSKTSTNRLQRTEDTEFGLSMSSKLLTKAPLLYKEAFQKGNFLTIKNHLAEGLEEFILVNQTQVQFKGASDFPVRTAKGILGRVPNMIKILDQIEAVDPSIVAPPNITDTKMGEINSDLDPKYHAWESGPGFTLKYMPAGIKALMKAVKSDTDNKRKELMSPLVGKLREWYNSEARQINYLLQQGENMWD